MVVSTRREERRTEQQFVGDIETNNIAVESTAARQFANVQVNMSNCGARCDATSIVSVHRAQQAADIECERGHDDLSITPLPIFSWSVRVQFHAVAVGI